MMVVVAGLSCNALHAADVTGDLVAALNEVPMSAPLAASAYFPLLPYGADDATPPQFMPLASNRDLQQPQIGVTRAIIAIHDYTRDADAAMNLIATLAGSNNATTIILAPQFLLQADILRLAGQLPDRGKFFVRWGLNGLTSPWEDGGDSITTSTNPKGISSFTAMDLLMIYLANRAMFPDLQQIIVVGHGSGGTFVQRYAALTNINDILRQDNLALRFVAANPTSFLYLTPKRPAKDKRRFDIPDSTTCPDYNAYRYGLDKLNDYGRRLGINGIKTGYLNHDVIYLTGEGTALQDTVPDSNCGALIQGKNRADRAHHYALYLDTLYGDSAKNTHHFVSIPKVGLNATAIFGTACGVSALFGDGFGDGSCL